MKAGGNRTLKKRKKHSIAALTLTCQMFSFQDAQTLNTKLPVIPLSFL